jgi:hypothetical protein
MKRLERKEILQRCGVTLGHAISQKRFHLCKNNFDEGEDWSHGYYLTFENVKYRSILKCRMPVAAGPKSSLSPLPSARPCRGVAADRSQIQYLESVSNVTAMELQNMAWENDVTAPPLLSVNEAVRCLTVIESHRHNKVHKEKEAVMATAATAALAAAAAATASSGTEAAQKKGITNKKSVESRNKNKRKRGDGNEADLKPMAALDMGDRVVKERTGFSSMSALLSFVAVVCNGDLEEMGSHVCFLIWLEEWFFYLEWVWGRQHASWRSASVHYSASVGSLKAVFAKKLQMVIDCVFLWPRFVSADEDVSLMSNEWKERYKGKRVIQWDNTNLNLRGQPSDANIQRAMYSAYYGGPVAKGRIFLQLSGWLGTWTLWAGAISDTEYMHASGILEAQSDYVAACKEHPNLPFTIILDKGYRCRLAAWRNGMQTMLQPWFAEADQKFGSKQVLTSAQIAHDRSGNERAVSVAKRSNLVKRGHHMAGDPATTDDVWIAWPFQANFMYKPVL